MWKFMRSRPDPVAEAEARWRKTNEAKRREAREQGCPCGAPATHVRRVPGAVGSVAPEFWTCAEHVNVNTWISAVGGGMRPDPSLAFDSPSMRQWAGLVKPEAP